MSPGHIEPVYTFVVYEKGVLIVNFFDPLPLTVGGRD